MHRVELHGEIPQRACHGLHLKLGAQRLCRGIGVSHLQRHGVDRCRRRILGHRYAHRVVVAKRDRLHAAIASHRHRGVLGQVLRCGTAGQRAGFNDGALVRWLVALTIRHRISNTNHGFDLAVGAVVEKRKRTKAKRLRILWCCGAQVTRELINHHPPTVERVVLLIRQELHNLIARVEALADAAHRHRLARTSLPALLIIHKRSLIQRASDHSKRRNSR